MASTFRSIVTNKIVVGVAIIAASALAFIEIRQMQKQAQVQKEIAALQRQAESLQKENTDLQKLSEYLKTNDYVEEAAREQLNKKKAGEYVYSFATEAPNDNIVTPEQARQEQIQNLSNPAKWWKYFFDNNS